MKTTILGILTIVSAISSAGIQFVKTGTIDLVSVLPLLTSGIGLIKAQDSRK